MYVLPVLPMIHGIIIVTLMMTRGRRCDNEFLKESSRRRFIFCCCFADDDAGCWCCCFFFFSFYTSWLQARKAFAAHCVDTKVYIIFYECSVYATFSRMHRCYWNVTSIKRGMWDLWLRANECKNWLIKIFTVSVSATQAVINRLHTILKLFKPLKLPVFSSLFHLQERKDI